MRETETWVRIDRREGSVAFSLQWDSFYRFKHLSSEEYLAAAEDLDEAPDANRSRLRGFCLFSSTNLCTRPLPHLPPSDTYPYLAPCPLFVRADVRRKGTGKVLYLTTTSSRSDVAAIFEIDNTTSQSPDDMVLAIFTILLTIFFLLF